MPELKLIIRTADQTRKAEISVAPNNKCAEILEAAINNWSLPVDTDYTIVNASTGKALTPNTTLENSGVSNGDILEIQPVLVAG
jgi:hypothetical protein